MRDYQHYREKPRCVGTFFEIDQPKFANDSLFGRYYRQMLEIACSNIKSQHRLQTVR